MKIATLTLNPAIDKSTKVKRLMPDDKLRCSQPTFEPGGGGINVSRAINILGDESQAIYLAGGYPGRHLKELLEKEGINQHCISIADNTRENLMVYEEVTGRQFRFGMPGSQVEESEWKQCLEVVKNLPEDTEFLVASGSLPPGVPADFYAQVAKLAKKRNIQCIIDTSGNALKKATDEGGCLLKPNLGELCALSGKEHINGLEQEEIAQQLIREGKASALIVSLGARGAMLATKDNISYVHPPTVKQESAVGAGDSMVAGIVLAMARKAPMEEVVRWGVAAGTAATITPGSELCRREDVERIFDWLNRN